MSISSVVSTAERVATFATSAEASTISNIASGSVAVVGAGGNTGQVFPNIILDAANNRSDYMVFDLSSLAGQSLVTATLTITQPGFYTSSDASENVHTVELHRRCQRAGQLEVPVDTTNRRRRSGHAR